MTSKKQIAFIFLILIVIGIIGLLTYLQIIIWSTTLVLVLAVLCIITAVILIIWWWLSRRKKGVRLVGRDLTMKQAFQLAFDYVGKELNLYFDMPVKQYSYCETRYTKTNKYFAFGGLGRKSTIENEKNPKKLYENPEDMSIIGRVIVVINATTKEVEDIYTKSKYNEYENIWKRLGIVSASREPEIVTKKREVSPVTGVEKEEITAPLGSPELETKKVEVI